MNRRSFLGMFAMAPFAGVAVASSKQQVVTELIVSTDEIGATSLSAAQISAWLASISDHQTISQSSSCRKWMFADHPLYDELHEGGRNASI